MRQFGLIGYPLSHSFSKKYFTEKFQREGIDDALFELYPIANADLLPALLQQHPDIIGLSVTIPHKEKITGYLQQLHHVVQDTGACNCIHVKNGKLIGYNTDVIGFQQSLTHAFGRIKAEALILGTGGAAKAVKYVLQQLRIPYRFVSRKPSAHAYSYEQLTQPIIHQHLLIINTTPLGMHPKVVEAPPIPYEALGKDHMVFDLVYNPDKTLFLQKAEQQGAGIKNGLEMLQIQAEESWKIWNS